MRPEKQQEKARETMDIYAPIAMRLGISKIKVELDDLSLKYLKPVSYTHLDKNSSREYAVSLTLTDEGKTKFAEATEANVGKQIAIVYDNQILSAPKVNEAITGGQAQITGMSDVEEAQNLASYIRIGSLSIELEELRSSVVAAQLGEEAISTSVLAGLIGLVIVIIFMILMYRVPGVVAGIALVLYTALVLITLNAFDITLTLPGIAGIILGIGMAVDANVIIYARIQEEIAAGNSVRTSIKRCV